MMSINSVAKRIWNLAIGTLASGAIYALYLIITREMI